MFIIAGMAYFLGLGAVGSKVVVSDAPLESQHLKPLQEQHQSSYQNQHVLKYRSHASQGSTLYSRSQQEFVPKNYATSSFFGVKNVCFGKNIASDRANQAWPGSQKQCEKIFFSTTSFSHPAETLTKRTLTASAYSTKTFYPDAQAQGGLDHDFQKALQQKKSPDEVREMLEK